MVSVYQLKARFQALLRPLVRWLAACGVSANQVTVAALALSALHGLALLLHPMQAWPWLLLPLTLFLRMALNAIDGMLAREHDQQSNLGALLNELGDVLSDTFLYLPFALHGGLSGWLIVLVCFAALLSEMTGVLALSVGAKRRYDGPMGKSDRAVVFGTVGFFLGLGVPAGLWLDGLFALTLVLLVWTVYNRAHKALEAADHG